MDTIPQDVSLSQTPPPGKVFIYGLRHPITKDVRYVGKTKRAIRIRLSAHLHEKGDTRKVRWIASLKQEGLIPEVIILDVVDEEKWEEYECYWIAHYRELGCDLTNLTDGGDGVHSPGEEARQRLSESRRQLFADPDFKARMLEVTSDPDRCIKISEALSGRKHTSEHVAKLPQNQPGRKIGEQQRQNVIQGTLRRLAQDKANGIVRRRTTPVTEQERLNRSHASTGRKYPNRHPWSEEEKLKRSLTQKGRPHTKAHNEAIAEGQKRRWESQKQERNNDITVYGLWGTQSDDTAV